MAEIVATRALPTPTLEDFSSIHLNFSDSLRLGSHLNILKTVLDQIKKDNTYRCEHTTEIFKEYVRQGNPSWIEIVKAFLAMGEEILAQKIMKIFGLVSKARESSQYKAVLKSYENIAFLTEENEFILTQFKRNGWLIGPCPIHIPGNTLVNIVLHRIASNVSDYDIFIIWLLQIPKACKAVAALIGMCQLSSGNPTVDRLSKPSMAELIKLQIPNRVVANYEDFVSFLFNDRDEHILCELKNKHRLDLYVCVESLKRWLDERGRLPMTWNALIRVIRDCGLNDVADDIERAMTGELSPPPTDQWSTPLLPQLVKLQIPQRVGVKCCLFVKILLDDNGSRVTRLRENNHDNLELICMVGLQQWLQGKGKQPMTWNTLIEVLRHSGLNDIADDIERNMTGSKEEEEEEEEKEEEVVEEEVEVVEEENECNTDKSTHNVWNKKELNVFFMNEIPSCQNDRGGYISKEEILQIANEWNDCGRDNVPKFVECENRESSDIRVDFISTLFMGNSESVIGQDALRVSKDKPTMWLNLAPTSREKRLRLTPKRYKRTIQHKFGHALGLQHEHQHPDAPPLYDNTKLRNYLSTRYGRSHEDIIKLRWEKVSASVWGPITPYDPHSVMHFMIPKEIRSQNYTGPTVLPLELSVGDKMRIVALYSGEDLEAVKDVTLTDDPRDVIQSRLKHYIRKAKTTGKILGSGTYGSVIELISGGKVVAGKVFRTSATLQLHGIAIKICGEVITLLQLSHPNIVQCKGVSLLPDEPLPILLMERLRTSLHDYLLRPDNSNLPVDRKVTFVLDTARGLEYLHSRSPAIIHRDLTATNVLLDSGLRAKIADFGNSRILDLDPHTTPMTFTSVPGTLEYMPPEAQEGVQGIGTHYDPSLDVFSFGHLFLFTIIQTRVTLLSPTYMDQEGRIQGRTEVARRGQSINGAERLLSHHLPLLRLMKQCLCNLPPQRPLARELVRSLDSGPSSVQETSERVDLGSGNQFTEEDTGEKRPTLPELLRLTIPLGVGAHWYNFGVLLLNDIDGSRVESIAEQCRGDPEKICERILRDWIQGKGLSVVTWQTLIQTLLDTGLSTLAHHVQTRKL